MADPWDNEVFGRFNNDPTWEDFPKWVKERYGVESPPLNPPSKECSGKALTKGDVLEALSAKCSTDPEVVAMEMRKPVGWSEVTGMAINEQLKNSITHTLSQLSYSGQDYIEEAREAVRRADYQVAAKILRSHGHALEVPDPRTDIIKFVYEGQSGRYRVWSEQRHRLRQELIAAALAWREIDKEFSEAAYAEGVTERAIKLASKHAIILDNLRAACDKYVEAQEK